MTFDTFFLQLKTEYPQLESEVRSILMTRAQNGATIQDIRDDYYNITGEKLPIIDNITDFLLTIPYVTAMCNENGTLIFNILPSQKTQHVYDMVIGQKPPSSFGNHLNNNYHNRNDNGQGMSSNNNYNKYWNYNRPSSVQMRSEKSSTRTESDELNDNANCYFEDNYSYLLSRFSLRDENSNNSNHNQNYVNSQQPFNNNYNKHNEQGIFKKPSVPSYRTYASSRGTVSPSTTKSNPDQDWGSMDPAHEANLFGFQLVGDDFLLYLARMELKCKFKIGKRILQSGLCVSGQTISAATKRILQQSYVNKRMIINLGSVDILQGKSLVQIQHDFLELLSALRERGVAPIITTLAPIALFVHERTIKEKVERFNIFIKQRAPKVIDIWSCVVNEKGLTLFDCFQDKPRQVTGSPESYLFWNKIGRQRVLKKIESEIEY